MTAREELPPINELIGHDPQALADELRMPICWTDHQVTRRQRIHGMNIPGQSEAFSSTHLNECLDEMHRLGFTDCILICEKPDMSHVACYCEFQALIQS